MPPAATVALLTTAVLAVILGAVGAELVWLGVRHGIGRLRHVPAAVALGAWSLVVAPVFLAGYRALWPVLGGLAPAPVGQVVGSHPLVGVVVAFVAWDAAGFAHHWLGHRTRIGWASHRPHHPGTGYDLSLALRQSWLPLPALVTFPLVALTGVPIQLALAVAAVSNVWQALLHTAAPVRLPRWVEASVMTPASHRLHHERGDAV